MNSNNNPSIEHQKLIRIALEKATGKGEWDTLTPITRGMSGASIYEVEVNYTFYIARISNLKHKNHWGSVLKNEYAVMEIASDADVSPKVYYADPEAGIVLMQFINSHPSKELDDGNIEHAESLAGLITRVRSCPSFHTSTSFIDITQGLVRHLNSQHPLVANADQLLESIKKELSDREDLRPSHRDMNPYNILFNGNRYYLIDWEAAAQDSLYLDPAMCVNYFYYDNADTAQHFLERCFGGALTEAQQHKLQLMRIASFICIGTNFLLMVAKSKQPLLSSDECQQLPSYSEYMKLIGVSKHFSDPMVLQEYGFVCFKEMQRLVGMIEAKVDMNSNLRTPGYTGLKKI